MNQELSKKTVFEDALKQLEGDKIIDPFYVQRIGEIDEMEEYLRSRPGVFFSGEDLILTTSTYHPTSLEKEVREGSGKEGGAEEKGVRNHFFHVCNEKLCQEVGRFGHFIVRNRKDFPLHVFYTLFMGLNDEYQPGKTPFEKNKIKFANRLFYYLDSPIDPLTLKSWGIELDLTAVNYEKVIDL